MALPVPHSAQLPFTLSEGKEIIVDGVAGHGDGFSINFCDGPNLSHQTALHFNPRLNQNEVVRTHNWGGWGQEEKQGGFPFARGAPYQVKIVVMNHAYQIYVNNNYFCDFNHRVAKEMCRFLFVTGDTQLTRVSFVLGNIYNPPVPLTAPIPSGVHPGRMIVVNGVPAGDSFSVNLMCGPVFESCDLSLHAAVRMGAASLVRTHRHGGVWGPEENNQPFFPFAQNAPFEMTILVEHSSFKIAVNGQHFAEFHHRVHPVHRADHLHIRGDVRVSQVRFM